MTVTTYIIYYFLNTLLDCVLNTQTEDHFQIAYLIDFIDIKKLISFLDEQTISKTILVNIIYKEDYNYKSDYINEFVRNQSTFYQYEFQDEDLEYLAKQYFLWSFKDFHIFFFFFNFFLVKFFFFEVTPVTFWLITPSLSIFIGLGLFLTMKMNGLNLKIWATSSKYLMLLLIYNALLFYMYFKFTQHGIFLKFGLPGYWYIPSNLSVFKLLIITLIILLLYLAVKMFIYFYETNIYLIKPEFLSILFFIIFGASMLFLQNDLFSIFIYVEIVSFCLYGLMFLYPRTNSQMHGLIKYVLFSLLIATFYVIGISFYLTLPNKSTVISEFNWILIFDQISPISSDIDETNNILFLLKKNYGNFDNQYSQYLGKNVSEMLKKFYLEKISKFDDYDSFSYEQKLVIFLQFLETCNLTGGLKDPSAWIHSFFFLHPKNELKEFYNVENLIDLYYLDHLDQYPINSDALITSSSDLSNLSFQKKEIAHSYLFLAFFSFFFIFKLGVGPFYTWTIEVYNSLSLGILLLVSLIPKLIYIPLMYFFFFNFVPFQAFWGLIFFLTGLFTLFISSMGILLTDRLKEIYAWSSITHTSNMLIIFSVISPISLNYLMFYLISYVLTSFMFLLILLSLRNSSTGHFIWTIGELNYLTNISAFPILNVIVLLASFIGFTPLITFFMKFSVFHISIEMYGIFTVICVSLFNIINAIAYIWMLRAVIGFNFNHYQFRKQLIHQWVIFWINYWFAWLLNLLTLFIIFGFFFYNDFTMIFEFNIVPHYLDKYNFDNICDKPSWEFMDDELKSLLKQYNKGKSRYQ